MDDLVEGDPRRATNIPNTQMKFMHRNVADTIFILYEGTIPHPWCDQYNIFIFKEALAAGQLGPQCERGERSGSTAVL